MSRPAVQRGPKKLSPGEECFALHCKAYELEPEREFMFAMPRKWRVDFAFLDAMLLVEIEGGSWSHGRHSRGAGFAADCVKYNYATMMGYKVLRYTTAMVESGQAIKDVLQMIPGPAGEDANT